MPDLNEIYPPFLCEDIQNQKLLYFSYRSPEVDKLLYLRTSTVGGGIIPSFKRHLVQAAFPTFTSPFFSKLDNGKQYSSKRAIRRYWPLRSARGAG